MPAETATGDEWGWWQRRVGLKVRVCRLGKEVFCFCFMFSNFSRFIFCFYKNNIVMLGLFRSKSAQIVCPLDGIATNERCKSQKLTKLRYLIAKSG